MSPGFVKRFSVGLAALMVAVGSAAFAADAKEKQKPKDKPYPLSVCLVSDEKLGEMGDPHVIKYKGREIKFCCEGCEKDFRDDPQKFLVKLDKASKSAATKPSTQPAGDEEKHDHGHDHKH